MKVCVIVAMESEYNALSDLLGGCTEGRIGRNDIVLSRCGIGKVNSAVTAAGLIAEHRPDCVISTGVAGGVAGRVEVMDAVVAREIVYHDVWCGEGNEYGQVQGLPARYRSCDRLYDHAISLDTTVNIHGGLICSGDRFIGDVAEMQTITRHFQDCLAVDMESASLAQVCYLKEIPFISFRVISDTPGKENNFQQYSDFWAELSLHSLEVIRQFIETLPESL